VPKSSIAIRTPRCLISVSRRSVCWASRISVVSVISSVSAPGSRPLSTSAPLKLKSGEVAVWVTERAIQILGGNGYTREFPVERWHRDAKIYDIFEAPPRSNSS
jgi:alkylation response protein AidB-like acyl-CoA dehydrogenase